MLQIRENRFGQCNEPDHQFDIKKVLSTIAKSAQTRDLKLHKHHNIIPKDVVLKGEMVPVLNF